MKTASLMPHKFVSGNEYRGDTIALMSSLTDVQIFLLDNCISGFDPKPTEDHLTISHYSDWNDYSNRLMLLARAAAYDCSWVLWSDDDWTFPGIEREKIERQIHSAFCGGCIGVSYKLREMWNETHYRSDGIWGQKRKVILQKNPLMERSVTWKETHLQKLHAVPLQEGNILEVDSEILHWGMSTPDKRKARMEKHKKLDPTNQFQSFGYDYFCDETGMELTAI